MAIKRAKVLDDNQLATVMEWVAVNSIMPERDTVILLLNYKAGLRAQEIARLEWKDVTDAAGAIGQIGEDNSVKFVIPSNAAKRGHEREVPMHPLVHKALLDLKSMKYSGPNIIVGAQAKNINGRQKENMSPNAVAQMLRRLYIKVGLEGCSSHSGRRTFITKLARAHNLHDCSIKDVQALAGHRDIKTTELYIEPSKNVSKLIRAI